MSKYRICNNTDTVDIDAQCIGLNIEGLPGALQVNRGLHIQIKHNRNKQAFEVANQVAMLFTAAPELLEIAKAYRNHLKTAAHTDGEVATFHHIESVLAKAEVETK